MKTEIEVKFLNIDLDDIRVKLKEAGAELVKPMTDMKRVLIEQPEHEAQRSFIRIRDEGDRTTLTFKRRSGDAMQIDDTKEIETEVGDFDTAVELFKEAGWEYKTYQETKRELWRLGDVEIMIDQWPWMPLQIEIEGPDEAKVRTTAETLGFEWSNAHYGHIDHVYREYYTFTPGFRGVIDLKEVRFDDPVPKEFGEARK